MEARPARTIQSPPNAETVAHEGTGRNIREGHVKRAILPVLVPLTLAGCSDVHTAVCKRTDTRGGTNVTIEWTTLDVPGYGPTVEIEDDRMIAGDEAMGHISATPRGFKTARLREVMILDRDRGVFRLWTSAQMNVLELDEDEEGIVYSWTANIAPSGSPAAQAAWEHRYEVPPVPGDAQAILRCKLEDTW